MQIEGNYSLAQGEGVGGIFQNLNYAATNMGENITNIEVKNPNENQT